MQDSVFFDNQTFSFVMGTKEPSTSPVGHGRNSRRTNGKVRYVRTSPWEAPSRDDPSSSSSSDEEEEDDDHMYETVELPVPPVSTVPAAVVPPPPPAVTEPNPTVVMVETLRRHGKEHYNTEHYDKYASFAG